MAARASLSEKVWVKENLWAAVKTPRPPILAVLASRDRRIFAEVHQKTIEKMTEAFQEMRWTETTGTE